MKLNRSIAVAAPATSMFPVIKAKTNLSAKAHGIIDRYMLICVGISCNFMSFSSRLIGEIQAALIQLGEYVPTDRLETLETSTLTVTIVGKSHRRIYLL